MATAIKCPKHTEIIKEGDNTHYNMYIILSGGLRVVKNYGEAGQTVLSTLGVGDAFGEMSLFLKKPRSASVVAFKDSVLLEITEDRVLEIISSNPKLLYGLIKTLCERIEHLNGKIASRSW